MDKQSWISWPFRAGVRLIEFLLRKSLHIYEFTDDPECIIRIQLTTAPHSVDFGSWKISKGETVLAIHAWNERMPKLPSEGATLAWAVRLRRLAIHSFEKVAEELQKGGKYSQVQAIYGESTIFSFSGHTGGLHMIQRLGFTVLPLRSAAGKFGEFWANLFSWWLMWAFNNASLDTRNFKQLERTEVWFKVDEFIQRFSKVS
jgi:hypothetical protein